MPQNDSQLFVITALHSWNQWLNRADTSFASISDAEMLTEIAPGKNRIVYIFGHLISVHDSMLPQLGLGTSSFSHLREIFIKQPDRAVEQPAIPDLRAAWKTTNQVLDSHFAQLTPEQWLDRHATVSAEDFAREPQRNRLGILLGRTAHLSYHLGQIIPAIKR